LSALLKSLREKLKDRGRVLLRTSGTEPVVRVMVEGEDEAEVRVMAQECAAVVEECLKG
jgi:phosphoglucosamine mutase